MEEADQEWSKQEQLESEIERKEEKLDKRNKADQKKGILPGAEQPIRKAEIAELE